MNPTCRLLIERSSLVESPLTKKQPCLNRMSVVPNWILNVAKGDSVQLLRFIAADNVQGYQDRPNDNASNEADNAKLFKKTKEEEAVKGAMIEHVSVGYPNGRSDPIEPSCRQSRAPLAAMIVSAYEVRVG
jgi:hypothetical protein